MQQRPATERDQQQCSPVLDTENIRTAILIAIFTIELNCGEIAKPQRIVRGLKGLHQNRGKSPNCKKTSPVAPRIGIHSQSVRDRSAVHPKPRQCRHNLLQSWGLRWNCRFKAIRLQSTSVELDCDTRSQLDCKTTKDYNAIGRIALKLDGLHANCSNGLPQRGIKSNTTQFWTLQNQSCNLGPISSCLHNPGTINRITINQRVKCSN